MPRWDLMTSTEIGAAVEQQSPLVILPIGATEQHGPHLASGCDTISADSIARLAAEKSGTLVLPALPYGCSLGHTDKWPGTVSLHPMTLTQVIVEVARWVQMNGIKKMLFLSGHATNEPPIKSAILQLRYEFPDCRYATMGLWDISSNTKALYLRDGEDIHANRGETSLLMHLHPEMVRETAFEDVADVTPGRVFAYAMPATTPNGVVGSPSEASAEDGKMMVETIVSDLETWIDHALAEDWPEIPDACGPVPGH